MEDCNFNPKLYYDPPFEFREITESHCEYWIQKADAISSPIVLLNYDYAYLDFNFIHHFQHRNIMILDEAHNIEAKLMKLIELNLSDKLLNETLGINIPSKLIDNHNSNDWLGFLEQVYNSLDNMDNHKLFAKDIKELDLLQKKIKKIKTYIENDEKNWVVSYDEGHVLFRPLTIDKYAEDILFKSADKILFMSATILDKEVFCKWLGLDSDAVEYISIKSPFKRTRRPIIMELAGSMSRRYVNSTCKITIFLKTIKFFTEPKKMMKNKIEYINGRQYNWKDI